MDAELIARTEEKILSGLFVDWASDQASRGRDQSALTVGNFQRETGIMVPLPPAGSLAEWWRYLWREGVLIELHEVWAAAQIAQGRDRSELTRRTFYLETGLVSAENLEAYDNARQR